MDASNSGKPTQKGHLHYIHNMHSLRQRFRQLRSFIFELAFTDELLTVSIPHQRELQLE